MRSAELANAQGAPTAAKQFVERALELLPADDLELRWRALLERHAALLRLSDPEALKADSEALDALAQKLADPPKQAEAAYRKLLWELSGRARNGELTPRSPFGLCRGFWRSREPHNGADGAQGGYRELIARAYKISDPEWRKSFLENMAEHRQLPQLWQRQHLSPTDVPALEG